MLILIIGMTISMPFILLIPDIRAISSEFLAMMEYCSPMPNMGRLIFLSISAFALYAFASASSMESIGLEQVRKRLELTYPGHYDWQQGVSEDMKEYKSILIIKI